MYELPVLELKFELQTLILHHFFHNPYFRGSHLLICSECQYKFKYDSKTAVTVSKQVQVVYSVFSGLF